MPLTQKQIAQLLQPINPRRVLRDGKGKAHVAQQDVTAHLTRIFGFVGWDKEVLNVALVFEQENPKNKLENPDNPKIQNGWDVCYRALVRLTLKDAAGDTLSVKEDGSAATAQNQARGDAHDLAYKSAISLSTKRAAKDLGDQFGLSLYNKGQLTALVMGTLVDGDPETEDVQEGVEQQVAMGNDEVEVEPDG